MAWLNSNSVDMSCFKIIPYKIGGEVYINAEKLLPLTEYDDYYVNLMDKSSPTIKESKYTNRRSLPKIDTVLEWGVVKQGDIIVEKVEMMRELFWQMGTSWLMAKNNQCKPC